MLRKLWKTFLLGLFWPSDDELAYAVTDILRDHPRGLAGRRLRKRLKVYQIHFGILRFYYRMTRLEDKGLLTRYYEIHRPLSGQEYRECWFKLIKPP